jgi:thymidylate kinase
MSRRPRLIAVDGANGRALTAAADRMVAADKAATGVSRWDASGLFQQLVMAGDDISTTSSRLLLLLYAADLAFRLRWEIEPALADGQSVVAAPYVDTALAFGRACGLPAKWLNNLFRFARKPSERHVISTAPAARPRGTAGFVEFGCAHLEWLDGRALAAHTRRHLGTGRASRLGGRVRVR